MLGTTTAAVLGNAKGALAARPGSPTSECCRPCCVWSVARLPTRRSGALCSTARFILAKEHDVFKIRSSSFSLFPARIALLSSAARWFSMTSLVHSNARHYYRTREQDRASFVKTELPLRGLDAFEYYLNCLFRNPFWPVVYSVTALLLHYFSDDLIDEYKLWRIWFRQKVFVEYELDQTWLVVYWRREIFPFLDRTSREGFDACRRLICGGDRASTDEMISEAERAERLYEEKLLRLHQNLRDERQGGGTEKGR
ncbi:unnamed protein product [Amoebophrya sp. A120]|nr:unnamed protein product [Amoebophrya sp. A120]|eukprot:GSA120T00014796001.1